MQGSKKNPVRESFGSQIGVIAAAAGSAVGLGNIWRFPYVAGENGGGAFLLTYLAFVLLIGVPAMLSEFVVGRSSQKNPVGAFRLLAPGTAWPAVGFIGVAAAFTILAFYTTVAGWTLEYLYLTIFDKLDHLQKRDLENTFTTFVANGWRPVMWQIVFMLLTGLIVFSGVKNGIERSTKILMPLLLIIIIALGIRSLSLPGAAEGLKFLFRPDFSKINADVMLQALGQAFFSLSIGMGTLITYGSYIRKRENLGMTALSVSLADTAIAILAGIAIFPAVFAFNIAPEAGPSLVFITLPMIFDQMAGGVFFELVFFILLAIAALTSTISVLEVAVAYFGEELALGRKKATIISTIAITVLGIFTTLSMGPLPELSIAGLSLFDLLDKTSANVLLPLGGLCIVIFVGWKLKPATVYSELSNEGSLKAKYIPLFLFIVKFLAPIAIALVFLNGLGLFGFFGGGDL
ncbi:MAG TPA: sodium-dependent transporter [Bacteroidales bacterium]|nr:sodium-dependent transporter [Bacteroidales bacterium]